MPVQPTCYAVVLDAGSSGTRIYIFKWKKWVEGTSLPQIEEVYNKDREPGISTLRANDDEALEKLVKDHLGPLFDCAAAFCAAAGVNTNSVPLFLLATAGMRDLQTEDPERYNRLLPFIERCTDASKFDVKQRGTITGEAEALYGWVAANYSWGSFSGYGQRGSQTAGYVEMGGASAQIAFPLYAGVAGALDDHQGRLVKVKIGASEFDMFLASYQLGVIKASKRYEEILFGRPRGRGNVILEPSKNFGWGLAPGASFLQIPEIGSPDRRIIKQGNEEIPARGTFDPPELQIIINQIPAQPPAPLPAHLQAALQTRTFLGGSNFWYNTREVFGRDVLTGKPKQTPFTFQEYREEVNFISGLDWLVCKDRLLGKKFVQKEKFLANACFTSTWIQRVLFDFFGFVDNVQTTTFTPYNGNDGVSLSWTLGKVILFALNSQPKEMDAVAVRNVNGIRGQARERDNQAHDSKVRAENAKSGWLQLEYQAVTTGALIAARDRPEPVTTNMQLARDNTLVRAAAAQLTWEQEHNGAENLQNQAQELRNEANAAEIGGVNAIPVAERWF